MGKNLGGLALLFALILGGGIGQVSAYDDIYPEEAYAMLDPKVNDHDVSNVYILDVRTPAEWYWVGHPGKDKCDNGAFLEEKVINIPWKVWTFDPSTQKYVMKLNRFFEEEVVRQFSRDDTIIIMCRSGGRSVDAALELEDTDSVRAAKRLEELGYYNIFNMLEGFEGGGNKTDQDPANCQHRTLDQGWKNKGLPYIDNDSGIWIPRQRGRSLVEKAKNN